MNEIVVETTLPEIKEWNGQRVVTFKDIDMAHQRPSGTSRNAFKRNAKHFIQDKDYFVCQTYEANKLFGISAPKGLTLLTETGYLMIIKPFTDDLSWVVQRRLVNEYFKSQQNQTPAISASKPCALTKNKEKTWSEKNLWKFQKLCKDMDWEMKYLHHKILSEVGERWNLDFFRNIYCDKYFKEPKYNMELINEFPDLQAMADKYLEYLMDAFGDMD